MLFWITIGKSVNKILTQKRKTEKLINTFYRFACVETWGKGGNFQNKQNKVSTGSVLRVSRDFPTRVDTVYEVGKYTKLLSSNEKTSHKIIT